MPPQIFRAVKSQFFNRKPEFQVDATSIPPPPSENESSANLELRILSSPMVVGRADESPGGTLSGHLVVHNPSGIIVTDNVWLRFSLWFNIKVVPTSPITRSRNLSLQTRAAINPRGREPRLPPEEVCYWDMNDFHALLACRIEETADQTFEFSLHIPGHLPASMQGSLSSIEYVLTATMTPSSGRPLHTDQPIQVQRTILPNRPSAICLRRYPDSQLVSKLTMPTVIHPIGEFFMQLELQGTIVSRKWTVIRRRVDELKWRIDETEEVKSFSEASARSSPGSSYTKNGTRKIGEGVVRVGRDRPACFDVPSVGNSKESIGFRVVLPPKARVACDVELDPDLPSWFTPTMNMQERSHSMRTRISISHCLVIEFNVVEEFYDNKTGFLVDRIKGRRRMYGAAYDVVIAERPPSCMDSEITYEREVLPRYCQRYKEPPAYEIDDR